MTRPILITGGTLVEFQMGEEHIGQQEVDKALEHVQTSKRPTAQVEKSITGELLTVRCASGDEGKVEEHLRASFPVLAKTDAKGGHEIPAAIQAVSATLGADYDRVAGRVVQLAEAIPADKYGWRPAEGVRTVSEVVMHVAAANYALAGALGVAPPAGADLENLEKVTDREQVLSTLKTSIDHAKQALKAAEGTDYNRMVNAFGFEMPAARAVVILDAHSHEHLGQLIAYARSNGVTPPWSQPAGD